jgi:hypothetical protein
MDTMSNEIERIIQSKYGRLERVIAFAEYFGPSSFAGTHDPSEEKSLKLFDVSLFKKGFISPQDFVKLFKDQSWAAEVVYSGNLNQPFITAVRENTLNLNEGVVCKGNGWATKIKTLAYLERLKQNFGDDWVNYAE